MNANLNPGARSLLNEQFEIVFPNPSSVDKGESRATNRGGMGSEVYVNKSYTSSVIKSILYFRASCVNLDLKERLPRSDFFVETAT
jgi:hypothetical protein